MQTNRRRKAHAIREKYCNEVWCRYLLCVRNGDELWVHFSERLVILCLESCGWGRNTEFFVAKFDFRLTLL